jgi:hypothetical protein
MLLGNKLIVGDFYCIAGAKKRSIGGTLRTYEEQIAKGLLPICDGELGDVICLSLREEDHGYLYYFHHESPPENDLFLIAENFEDFISKLEIHEGSVNDSAMLKDIKVQLTPEFIALLNRDGYGPKN